METLQILTNFYSNYDEDGRLRSKHGLVEFLTTMRYIGKYLKPGMRIAEIGAGTGRYSHSLAQDGYQVDAVELVDHNIRIFRENTMENEPVTIRQGNAMDLSFFSDETYDITLLLGPMYHLYTEEDQLRALTEAIRITKKGGVVFAAYCNNDATMLQYCFGRDMIRVPRYQRLIDFETFKLNSTPREIFALYRKEDVDTLMSEFNVTRLHYVGSDMLTRFLASAVDEMDEKTFEMYMKYHLCICERKDMVGATAHMLDIFRKE